MRVERAEEGQRSGSAGEGGWRAASRLIKTMVASFERVRAWRGDGGGGVQPRRGWRARECGQSLGSAGAALRRRAIVDCGEVVFCSLGLSTWTRQRHVGLTAILRGENEAAR